MKKKPLLFALLALAIVTSLTAGTLAVYTKSVSLAGDVQIKKFAFTAIGTTDQLVKPVKLAPDQSDTTTFTVTNKDDKGRAEVNLGYAIDVDIVKTEETMVGLKAELFKDDVKVGEGTKFKYEDTMSKESDVTHNYKVTLTWVDDDSGAQNANQSAIGTAAKTYDKGLTISVVATQDTKTI